jgi:tripartite ATP-independent transporter DctM subunit
MSPELVGLIGIAVLVVLLLSGMWIGVAMAIIAILGIGFIRGFAQAFTMSGIIPFQNISFYPISVLPMFILMGVIIAETGIGEDLYYTAYRWIGQLRGGLAMATVIACAGLAAVTGISAAAIVTMGKVALPEMRKYNYDVPLATGSIACAGTVALLIPPSIAFVMYGILTENSIGKLFIAGILPGILLSALFAVAIFITTTVRPKAGPPGPKTSLKEKIMSLNKTWHVIILFLLVLGGIYGGIFTPTEAGAVGAFGAFVIAAAYRRLTPKIFLYCLKETALMSGMILFIIAGAFLFMHFMAVSKLPFAMGDAISALHVPRMVIFTGIVFIYIILGMFLDIMSCIMLTIPIVYPAMLALGFDPIWFGVMLVILIQMGLVTPPVGMDVFFLSGVTGVPVGTIFRGIVPFCIAIIICIILLAAFPQIALVLPSMMTK